MFITAFLRLRHYSLSQFNPAHTLIRYVFKIHFSVIITIYA
jgi:hypothetical protein